VASHIAKVKGKAALLFDGGQLILEAGGASLEANDGFLPDDFPTMNPALYQTRCTLPASVLLAGLLACIPSISDDPTRYYLRGVYFHGWQATGNDPASLRLVSTDGHRLARYDLPADWPAVSQHDSRGGVIVHRKACEVLARLLKDAGDSPVEIATDHTHACKIMFIGDGWRLESKVIDGTYPDYTRVCPMAAPVMSFMLSAADLPAVPKGRCSLAVKLDADAGRMSWLDGSTVSGRDLLADGDGATGFNIKYLTDFAKIAPDGLTIESTGSGDPARVTTSDPRFLGIVMPMRV
jgi:DNA polymerase III subunit beta